ncbi:hypothetical protein RJT34_25011 [Clitoria ternatea]|uniref:CCHC-type domain-containing protein n=1 Tax=Clitoria ternatea TaxID=43366 RepID=A0AAN9FPA7_CLITE
MALTDSNIPSEISNPKNLTAEECLQTLASPEQGSGSSRKRKRKRKKDKNNESIDHPQVQVCPKPLEHITPISIVPQQQKPETTAQNRQPIPQEKNKSVHESPQPEIPNPAISVGLEPNVTREKGVQIGDGYVDQCPKTEPMVPENKNGVEPNEDASGNPLSDRTLPKDRTPKKKSRRKEKNVLLRQGAELEPKEVNNAGNPVKCNLVNPETKDGTENVVEVEPNDDTAGDHESNQTPSEDIPRKKKRRNKKKNVMKQEGVELESKEVNNVEQPQQSDLVDPEMKNEIKKGVEPDEDAAGNPVAHQMPPEDSPRTKKRKSEKKHLLEQQGGEQESKEVNSVEQPQQCNLLDPEMKNEMNKRAESNEDTAGKAVAHQTPPEDTSRKNKWKNVMEQQVAEVESMEVNNVEHPQQCIQVDPEIKNEMKNGAELGPEINNVEHPQQCFQLDQEMQNVTKNGAELGPEVNNVEQSQQCNLVDTEMKNEMEKGAEQNEGTARKLVAQQTPPADSPRKRKRNRNRKGKNMVEKQGVELDAKEVNNVEQPHQMKNVMENGAEPNEDTAENPVADQTPSGDTPRKRKKKRKKKNVMEQQGAEQESTKVNNVEHPQQHILVSSEVMNEMKNGAELEPKEVNNVELSQQCNLVDPEIKNEMKNRAEPNEDAAGLAVAHQTPPADTPGKKKRKRKGRNVLKQQGAELESKEVNNVEQPQQGNLVVPEMTNEMKRGEEPNEDTAGQAVTQQTPPEDTPRKRGRKRKRKKNVVKQLEADPKFPIGQIPPVDPALKSEAPAYEEICFFCGEIGHSLGKCVVSRAGGGRFAKCLFCYEHGHFSFNCPRNGRGIDPEVVAANDICIHTICINKSGAQNENDGGRLCDNPNDNQFGG